MYKQEIIVIDYNGLIIEVHGHSCEGEKGDYFHPASPTTFEVQEIYLTGNHHGSDVEIMSMLNRNTIEEIESQCLTEITES